MGHLFRHRSIIFVCCLFAAVVWALPLPLQASGFAHTLGINFTWDIPRTKKHFAKAGIPEKDFRGEEKLEVAVTAFTAGLLPLLGPPILADTIAFDELDITRLPAPECLYYENAIEPREDIAFIAICFYGKEEQVLVIPFFRTGAVDAATLAGYLTDEYGRELGMGGYGSPDMPPGTPRDAPAGLRMWSWRSALLVGLPRKYVFLFEQLPGFPGIAAAIAYVDAVQLNELNDDMQAAAELSKKAARKGL